MSTHFLHFSGIFLCILCNFCPAEKPGKLFQDLLDINKKYKLGLKVPVVDEVKKWVEAAAAQQQ